MYRNFEAKLVRFKREQLFHSVLEHCDFKHKAKVYIASGGLFSEFG